MVPAFVPRKTTAVLAAEEGFVHKASAEFIEAGKLALARSQVRRKSKYKLAAEVATADSEKDFMKDQVQVMTSPFDPKPRPKPRPRPKKPTRK